MEFWSFGFALLCLLCFVDGVYIQTQAEQVHACIATGSRNEMFLSTPLSLNFLLLLGTNLIEVVSAKTKTADVAATTVDLFNLAYPVVAYPIASVSHKSISFPA